MIWLPPIASDITNMEMISKSISLVILNISFKSLSPFPTNLVKNVGTLFHFLLSIWFILGCAYIYASEEHLWTCCSLHSIPNPFVLSPYLNIFNGVDFLLNKVKIPYTFIHWSIHLFTHPSIHPLSTMSLFILFLCLESFIGLNKCPSLLSFDSKLLLTLSTSINYKASYIHFTPYPRYVHLSPDSSFRCYMLLHLYSYVLISLRIQYLYLESFKIHEVTECVDYTHTKINACSISPWFIFTKKIVICTIS